MQGSWKRVGVIGLLVLGGCPTLDVDVKPIECEPQKEVCDGIDNDCTGTPDEGVETVYYPDLDEDGYGSSEYPLEACDPPEGYVENDGDPDDYDPDVP